MYPYFKSLQLLVYLCFSPPPPLPKTGYFLQKNTMQTSSTPRKVKLSKMLRFFFQMYTLIKDIDVTFGCDIWTQISVFREMRISPRSVFNLLCMTFAVYTLVFILQVFTPTISYHKPTYKGKRKLFLEVLSSFFSTIFYDDGLGGR